jgi:hypothetical protein
MAARDPWRSEERDPDTRSRACRGQHRGRCDPPRHRASTWKRPTRGCAPHDTGPSRCPSTPMSSSTATASSCSTPARTGRRSPTRATSQAAPPESSTTASRASTSPPAIRSPPGWRPSATTSPMGELRCCPISTRTTSAGCRSSNAARGHGSRARPLRDPAPTGVPVAPAEQPAPPRASGRLPRGRAWLVPALRGWRRPVGLVGATDHGRGGRDGRVLGRRRLALQVLLADVPVQVVARSEQQATGHALHGHRWLLSQHRAPLGGTPPRRRRPHSQQDRSAWRL